MLKEYFTLLCLLVFFLFSCNEDALLDTNSNDTKVQITAHIEDSSVSRVNVGINGKGSFVDGDVISLMYGSNVKSLTLNNGQWTPPITWSEIGDQSSFSAFYPERPLGSFMHNVLLNQNEGKNFEESDLLYASPVVVEQGKTVNLNFKHLMGCLTIILDGEGLSEQDMEKAELTVKGFCQVQVSGEGEVEKAKLSNNVQKIRMKYRGNNTFQAILCPQNTHIDYGYDGWLTIKVGKINHTVKAPSFPEIESGKNITIKFTFRTEDPEIGGKTLWVYGLKDIPQLDNSAWISLNGPYLKQLIWTEGSNWYDCDKLDSSNSTYDDHRMCWAATASNMIHWWLDRNSDLVGNYIKENNIPSQYKNHRESEIFNIFKQSFTDEGSFIEEGLNWFFLKKYTRLQDDAASLTDKTTGGYFKEVLSTVADMTEKRGISTLNDFSSVLKYAFNNQKAVGIVIYLAGLNNGGRHAMTLWGAKFDKKGSVCEIYYCDNNDGGDSSEKPHLIAAKVRDINGVRLQGSDKNGSFSIRIEGVVMLDLKRAELAKYFQ